MSLKCETKDMYRERERERERERKEKDKEREKEREKHVCTICTYTSIKR